MSETKWTTEYPTAPGFYWVRNIVLTGKRGQPSWWKETCIVLIDRILNINVAGADQVQWHGSVESAEWYGPLEPPE